MEESLVSPDAAEEIEGMGSPSLWGDYPINEVLVRQESRTIHDVIRRIQKGTYIMDPDFQREFLWPEDKQSKLIESVIMRVPLPVFYMAENENGKMVVVDGLQRLTTFVRFVKDKLALKLPDRKEFHRKKFSNLHPKLQNRIEDANLIFYTIDSKVPEAVRFDIFDRVNSGEPLTRQQMRNCLYQGPATKFLKEEARTEVFLEATGRSLNPKTMRDREFVNRFCAFQILELSEYNGDMDRFLAEVLKKMNSMEESELSRLSSELHTGMVNNYAIFRQHAFRKHESDQERRSVLNASLWDVLSTGLSRVDQDQASERAPELRRAIQKLFEDEDFNKAITYATNDTKRIQHRFDVVEALLKKVFD